MRFAIVTLFPEMFAAVTDYGITGRAYRAGLAGLECFNPRDFATDRHRTVDDKPFGGGPGMLMKTAPLQAAIHAARESLQQHGQQRVKSIYLSPQGRLLDQAGVRELAGREGILLVCGRYQGIDQRLLDAEIDEEWSIGDYVISGGELAAMVVADSVIRCLPGALGDEDSAEQDSFANGLLHSPEYTRPQMAGNREVPEVLLSGNHEQIRRWRLKQSLGATWLKRPDLLARQELNSLQETLLQEFIDAYKSNTQATDK